MEHRLKVSWPRHKREEISGNSTEWNKQAANRVKNEEGCPGGRLPSEKEVKQVDFKASRKFAEAFGMVVDFEDGGGSSCRAKADK